MRDLARVALSLKPLFSAPSEELELKFLGIVGQQSLPTLDIETTQRAEDRDLCSPSRRPSQGRGRAATALQGPSKESRRMWFCEMKPMSGGGGLQQGHVHRVRSGLSCIPPPDVLVKSRVPTLRALAEE